MRFLDAGQTFAVTQKKYFHVFVTSVAAGASSVNSKAVCNCVDCMGGKDGLHHEPAQGRREQMTQTQTDSAALFEASRRRLLSIAYRMLGSMSEAEDVLQETWIRWHDADRRQLKMPVAWLTTVVTNLSIDRLRRLQRERAAESHPWLPEPWLEQCAPSPEDAVSMLSDLSYGVMLLLERLSPEERAALLLHEVFDCPYDEIARALDRKPEHCRQLVRRAKERVRTGPARRATGEEVCEQLVHDFLCAIRSQDKQAMMHLLAPGAMVIGDSGHGSSTPVASLATAQAARSFIHGTTSLAGSGLILERVCINGGWGAVLTWRGSITLALSFEMDGQYISTIYAVADQRKLKHMRRLHLSDSLLPDCCH
jgi:RNA polymerase sigma factor (sigma-70 family)